MKAVITNYPAVRLLFALVIGIGCSFLFPLPVLLSILGLALIASSIVFLLYRQWTPLYWVLAITCGVWVGIRADHARVHYTQPLVPEMRALITGEIIKIIRQDSASLRCLVDGTMDARALPALDHSIVALTIVKPDSTYTLSVGSSIYASGTVRPPHDARLSTDFDEDLYYSALGVQWIGMAKAKDVALEGRNYTFRSWVSDMATAINRTVLRLFPDDTEGIAVALLTGEKSHITFEQRKAFSLTGTAHVLAVSGLHVGVIAMILLMPLGFVRNVWIKLGLFILALTMYTLVTGAEPSTVRSAVMAILLMTAYNLQREVSLLNVLCLTVVLMLLIDPSLLYSVGFHLSVASLFGIALFYPLIYQCITSFVLKGSGYLQRSVAASLSVTFAASVVVSPVVAYYFSVFSVVSPLANLLIIPLTTFGMVYTLCAVIFSGVSVPLGVLFAAVADCLYRWAQNINSVAASFRLSAVQGEGTFLLSLLVSAALLYLCTTRKRRHFLFRLLVAVLCGMFIALLVIGRHIRGYILSREQIVAVVWPVGQGKTIVLMQDRRPDLYPHGDRGLETYCAQQTDSLLLFTAGPASLYTAAAIAAHGNVSAVIPQTLRFKNKRQWAALDSLEFHGKRVISGEQFFANHRSIHFPGLEGASLQWDVWQNAVRLVDSGRTIHIQLPRIVYDTQY